MQILSHIQSLDRLLNSTLHNSGRETSTFAWYLTLQAANIEQYNAKNHEAVEDDLPYFSINLPSAPKATLYLQEEQLDKLNAQGAALHHCQKPALSIQFYNCLQPQSLHWQRQEQVIPFDVVENASIFAQNELRPIITPDFPGSQIDETLTKDNFVDAIFSSAKYANESHI